MYQRLLSEKLNGLKATGQYRTFVTLNRICGQYPLAQLEGKVARSVVVWCSNDYLGMSQHPVVRKAMHSGSPDAVRPRCCWRRPQTPKRCTANSVLHAARKSC